MTFPTNIPSLTVWEKTVTDRAPAYLRHRLGACYWEETRGQSIQSGDVRHPDDSVFLAVPEGAVTDYVPKKDDRILPGNVEAASPPGTAFTVVKVSDFRYGSPMMRHMEVTLK